MEDARCHARLAGLLAAAGRHERAVAHYERALLRLLEAAEAKKSGKTGAEERGSELELRMRLGRSLAALGRRREAVDELERVVKHAPENAAALVNLAALLMMDERGERLRDAERLCARAIALRPDFPDAHFNMNVVLRRLGRQREATAVYWGYLERNHGLRRALAANYEDDSRPRLRADSTAVICVKWGDKYGSEYVNKLFRGVLRNCTAESSVDVICLTDAPEGIEQHERMQVVELESGWKGWWNKAQVFSPHVMMKVGKLGHNRCVYVDLDTVIVRDVSELLLGDFGSGLALLSTDGMANEQRKQGFNSSIMVWGVKHAPALAETIYEPLKQHINAVGRYIYKFDHWLEVCWITSYTDTSMRHANTCYDSLDGDSGRSVHSELASGPSCRILQPEQGCARVSNHTKASMCRVLPVTPKASRSHRCVDPRPLELASFKASITSMGHCQNRRRRCAHAQQNSRLAVLLHLAHLTGQ